MKILKALLMCLALAVPSFGQTHVFPAKDTDNVFTGKNSFGYLNRTLVAGSTTYGTIQQAITAACGMSGNLTVDVEVGTNSGTDITTLTGCPAVFVRDNRAALPAFYLYTGGSYVLQPIGGSTLPGLTSDGATLSFSGTGPGSGFALEEGSVLTGLAGFDVFSTDSSTHKIKLSLNNGPFYDVCTTNNCGGGISGQTTNYVPLATSDTTSTISSHFFRASGQSGVDEAFGQFQHGSQCNYPGGYAACNFTHILDDNDSTTGASPGSVIGESFNMYAYGGGGGLGAVESRVTKMRDDNDSQNGMDTPGIKQLYSSTQSVYGVGDIGILYQDNTVHGGMAYGADQGSQNLMRIEEISVLVHGTINAGSNNRQLHITKTTNCVAPLSYLCTPVPGSWLIDTTTAVAAGKGTTPQTTSAFGVGLASVATDQTTIPTSSVYGIAHSAAINPSRPYENPADTTLTFDTGVGSFAPGDAVCVLPVNQSVGFEEQSIITSVSGSAGAQTIHLPLSLVQDSPAVFKGYCMYLSFDADAAQGVRYALPAVSIDGSHIIYGYPITSTLQGGVIPADGVTYSLFNNSSRSGWHLYRGARVWKLETTSPGYQPLDMANVITYVEPNGTFAVGDTVEAVDYAAQKIDGLDLYAGQDMAGINPAHSTALTAHITGKGINGNSAAVVVENDASTSQFIPYGGVLSEPAAIRTSGPFDILVQGDTAPNSSIFYFNNHQPGQTSYQILRDPAWGALSIAADGLHFSNDFFGGSYWSTGVVSSNIGLIAGSGTGSGNQAGTEYTFKGSQPAVWFTQCHAVGNINNHLCATTQGNSRVSGGGDYSVTGDVGIEVGGIVMGANGPTNSTLDFGSNYGADAIDLYSSGTNKYYWGLNAGEMQFGVQDNVSGTHFSFNAAPGGLQPSGTNEYARLTPRTSGGGWTLASGEGYGWSASTTSSATEDTKLWRTGAGAVCVGNATAGNCSGTFQAANYGAGALASAMTATTQTAGDNSTKVATTAYVDGKSYPLYLNWSINSGAAATDASPRFLASHAGSISACYVLTTASDGATALTFNIFQNGTSIFSGGAQTIAAGTAAGTLTTLGSLTGSPLSVANNDKFSINITSGTSTWVFAVQCK